MQFLEWLESSALGAIARESLYGFQILVAIHLLGLVFSVGILLWVDLRMLGACLIRQRLADVYRELSKWFGVGFTVMFASGLALFAGFATSAYENTFFRIKVLVIVLAGINAGAFHILLKRAPAGADPMERPSNHIRFAGLASIVCWVTVILCGRMMSYTLF